MKTMKYVKQILGVVCMTLLSLTAVQTANAVAPANSTITNTASLKYTGLVNAIQASVDVTVLLVPSTPTVIAPTATTVAEGQVGTLVYKLRANANGPDTYTFNAPTSVATAVTGSGAPSVPANLILGATASAAVTAIGSSTITVPVDLNPADNIVNEITVGDSLVIGGNVYVVTAVVENAATKLATITLGTPLTTAVAIGDLIVEEKSFTVTITAGTVTNPATAGTEVISVVAKDLAGVAAASAPVAGTVNVVAINYVKSVSVNGAAFVVATPNVVSGDVLTYRLLVQVPANSTLNGVTLTDTIPTFMTYVANSTTLDVDGPAGAAAPIASPAAAVADVAGTTRLAGGMLVSSTNPGAAIADGTIVGGLAGVEVSVDFQVTVD